MAMAGEAEANSFITMASIDSQAFSDDWQEWLSEMALKVSKDQPVSSKRKGWAALSHIFCRRASAPACIVAAAIALHTVLGAPNVQSYVAIA